MRAYLRLDPQLADKKADYPDGAFRAFVEVLCWSEQQHPRGVFRSRKLLAVLLEKRARWITYLIDHGDLIAMPTGQLVVEGWTEWQEGDLKVHDRMRAVRERRGEPEPPKSPGAQRTANYRLRTSIFERDDYTCQYCGITDYERDWLVLEHIIPNGPTEHDNLTTACRPCNKRKGGRTPEEAGMPLLSDPRNASRDASQNASPPSSGGGKPSAVSQGGGGSSDEPADEDENGIAQNLRIYRDPSSSESAKRAARKYLLRNGVAA